MVNRNLYRTAIHHKLSTIYLCLMFMAGILASSSAQAQDNESRLRRIENEIQTLSRAVFRGEKPPPGSVAIGDNVSTVSNANTELRLQQIELELRTLTGLVEQRNFEAQQLQQTVNALEAQIGGGVTGQQPAVSTVYPTYPPYDSGAVTNGSNVSAGLTGLGDEGIESTALPSSFDTRVMRLDDESQPALATEAPTGQLGTLRTPANAPSPPDVTAYTAPPMTGTDPVGLYEQAFSYLKDKDYSQAETAFQDFLERYPSHDLAANAKYWLGESFYVRNNYERAARVFAEAYQQYPKGPKGPDNLLKLGMSLAGLGKSEDACVTYGQLRKEYPHGAMPILMRAEQEMEKLGCQQF